MGRPFGWLIVADPTDLLDAETADLRDQLTVLRRYEDEHARFEADRAERRLAELDAYREAGLWNVRVLAGAATEQDLRLIAPVLVGSADLSAHPYRLRCPDGAQEFADVLAAKVADPADGSMVPFAATAGALAALTGLPRREVPGVRVMQPGYFDVTSEAAAGPSVELGKILDGQDRPVGAMRIPLATLNRHALVTGATGAGKSQTVRHLLEQLTRAGIGWLAIEPVKSEYAAMGARLAGLGLRAGRRRPTTADGPRRAQRQRRPSRSSTRPTRSRCRCRSTRWRPSPATRCRRTSTWSARCSWPPSTRRSRSRRSCPRRCSAATKSAAGIR